MISKYLKHQLILYESVNVNGKSSKDIVQLFYLFQDHRKRKAKDLRAIIGEDGNPQVDTYSSQLYIIIYYIYYNSL